MIILTWSQGGSGGKWQTPHQKSKASTPRGGGKIEPGDAGIWATCMKSKEGKATEELKSLFEQVSSGSTACQGATDHLSSLLRSSTIFRLSQKKMKMEKKTLRHPSRKRSVVLRQRRMHPRCSSLSSWMCNVCCFSRRSLRLIQSTSCTAYART